MSLIKRLNISSTRNLYTIISIIFIIFVLVFAWLIHSSYVKNEKEIVRENLYRIAVLLDKEIKVPFSDILLQHNALDANYKDKIKILNKELQPIIERISNIYKDYGMGIYSIGLDSVLAIGPDFKSEYLQRVSREYPYFKSYQSGKTEYSYSEKSRGWSGKSIYNITVPIYRGGEIIGHTWANYRLDDVYRAANNKVKVIFLISGILLIVVLFLTRVIIDTYNNQMYYLAKSISLGCSDSDIKILSPLKPLVSKIKEEKEIILRQEKELAKLERFYTVGEMAATLAHEVRNPLTTIDGYIQLIKLKSKDSSIINKLNVISKEVVSVNSIISEYLAFARDRVSKKESQDLNSIIDSVYPLLQSDANRNRKTVIFKPDNYLPDIQLNDKEIRQLIFNISRNGLEAMDEGGVLTIKTYTEDKKVVLEIRDQGSGIPDDIIDKISKPFYTTKENGTGLGLSVCYQIAKSHNGIIEIDSSDKGTTFYIKFNNEE